MATIDATSGNVEARTADPSLVTLTHVIYGLHAASVVIAIATSATIILTFLFSIPSILAVILNYVRRNDARGTFLDSHFRWQIRTFWFTMLWAAIGGVLFITILLIPLAIVIWVALALWLMYRIVRGWWNLKDGRAMP